MKISEDLVVVPRCSRLNIVSTYVKASIFELSFCTQKLHDQKSIAKRLSIDIDYSVFNKLAFDCWVQITKSLFIHPSPSQDIPCEFRVMTVMTSRSDVMTTMTLNSRCGNKEKP